MQYNLDFEFELFVPGETIPATAKIIVKAGNYRITFADIQGERLPLQKAQNNIQAIRLIKLLNEQQRPATPAEQTLLAQYCGWGNGALANKLFPRDKPLKGRWLDAHNNLHQLLNKAELDSAARSTQYAHYTPKPVIDAIYRAISRFGLQSGLALEGGTGTGHFIGCKPADMRLHYTGFEMDGISTQIAQALYPDATIIQGDFTKIAVPENHYDLALGNPPFAGFVVRSDIKYQTTAFYLHDYFIAKQIDALRPGGLGVFITSTGTLDKADPGVREYLAKRANLLGAIRLPNTTFEANAGTKVVTDILFFQKKTSDSDMETLPRQWIDRVEVATKDGPAVINQYFADHPDKILGELVLSGDMYGGEKWSVNPTGDLPEQLAGAIDKLPLGIYQEQHLGNIALKARVDKYELTPSHDEASYYLSKNGRVFVVEDGVGRAIVVRGGKQRCGFSQNQARIIRDYIPLRDAVGAVYKAQGENGDWQQAQTGLHRAYDHFVAKHGPINQVKFTAGKDGKEITRCPIINTLANDPMIYHVAAIERYDEGSQVAEKGPVFFENILEKPPAAQIGSAIDALNITLNETGTVDIERIAELYGRSIEDTLTELDDAVFKDPQKGYVSADEYLSGNVKEKLAHAKQHPALAGNVKALEAVQPEDIAISDIPLNLGAFWIPLETVQRFAESSLNFTGKITNFIKREESGWNISGQADHPLFATGRRQTTDILDAALNKRSIKVMDYYIENDQKKSEVNNSETAAANQKVTELKRAFGLWIMGDSAISQSLHEIYNRDFNTNVPRKYNGKHLSFPGLSCRYLPHASQANVAWRIVQTGNTYMAHAVGLGKTLASILAGMELRRLGLTQKPCYVVLKSTLKQFATEYLNAYPCAKILVADETQLDKKNRRRFLARICSEEWDAIIMTHQSFEKLPLSREFIKKEIEQDLDEYRALLDDTDEEDRVSIKTLERQIETLKQKLEHMSCQQRKDQGLTFEQTGIDFLFVDEAHYYKKIPFPTNQANVKGVDSQGSNIAYDMYLKSRYLHSVHPGHYMVLMSGTPVTNTLGELFNIQRYLQADVLENNMTSSFDAWSSMFADTVTELEMQPSGNFKLSTRLARFVGIPGLMRDVLQIADIIGEEQIQDCLSIKRPKVKGGTRKIISVERSDELKAYQQVLSGRIEKLAEKKGPPKKGEDNILVVIGDAKKASIDLHLIGQRQSTPSKLDLMIDNVYKVWRETRDYHYLNRGKKEPFKGATQIIFSELRQAAGFDIYHYIQQQLVAKGLPAEKIAFIQDYNTSKKKRTLFRQMNTGEKLILIAGSKSGGTGINVQQRLIALHHLDITYVPADILQREGRMIRQGNKNDEVMLFAYATTGTIDAFLWQLNENKQRMINQVLSADLSLHSVADISDNASQMAQAKALASGNPLLLEQAGIAAEVAKLQNLKAAHINQQFNNGRLITRLNNAIDKAQDQLPRFARYADAYRPAKNGDFSMILDGRIYTERATAGKRLRVLWQSAKVSQACGSLCGLELSVFNAFAEKTVGFESGSFIYSIINGEPLCKVGLRREDDNSDHGLILKLENIARKLAGVSQNLSDDIGQAQQKVKRLKENHGIAFAYEGELEEKQQRLGEIDQALGETGETETDDGAEAAAA